MKNKHLTLSERITIQEMLERKQSFRVIADKLGKSVSTVSREIRRVCNGCDTPRRHNCYQERYYYDARLAQSTYEKNLSSSREGISKSFLIFFLYTNDVICYI